MQTHAQLPICRGREILKNGCNASQQIQTIGSFTGGQFLQQMNIKEARGEMKGVEEVMEGRGSAVRERLSACLGILRV